MNGREGKGKSVGRSLEVEERGEREKMKEERDYNEKDDDGREGERGIREGDGE